MSVRRVVLQIHLWLGVVAGLYILIISLTGAALVFRIDIQRALHPDLFTPTTGTRAHPAAILDAVAAAYPDHQISFIDAPTTGRPVYLAYPFKENVYRAVLVDPVTTRVLGEVPERSFARTLQRLHFDLLGGRTGRRINGIGAFVILALCVTGVLLWWQSRSNWNRLTWQVHRAIGISTLAFIVLMAVTGLSFTFPSSFRSAVTSLSPTTVVRAPLSDPAGVTASSPTWRELIDRARLRAPGQHVAQVFIPATETAAFRVTFSRVAPTPMGVPALTDVYLDRYTGEALPDPPRPPATAGDLVMRWVAPLHVGSFGGLPIKVAWLVLGLAPPTLFVTGFVIWWTKGPAGARGSASPLRRSPRR